MQELNLRIDETTSNNIKDLMTHYQVTSKAQILSKAMALLTTAAYIEKEHGELVARKGSKETKIIVR